MQIVMQIGARLLGLPPDENLRQHMMIKHRQHESLQTTEADLEACTGLDDRAAAALERQMYNYMRSSHAHRATWTETRITAQPLAADHPVALANARLREELLADYDTNCAEMGLFAHRVSALLCTWLLCAWPAAQPA